MYYIRTIGYYNFDYNCDFYFPKSLHNKRRGQRLAHAKIRPFWDNKTQKFYPVLTFGTIGSEQKSNATTELVRKRCIGEFKRKVL